MMPFNTGWLAGFINLIVPVLKQDFRLEVDEIRGCVHAMVDFMSSVFLIMLLVKAELLKADSEVFRYST